MIIFVDYYTGSNGESKRSTRVFKSYKALKSNLHTFKWIKDIVIIDVLTKIISGEYNIKEFLKNK